MRGKSSFYPAVIPNAGMIQARRQGYTPAGFSPPQFPGLQCWYDPFDLGAMTLERYAKIDTSQTGYFQTADHADFNFSTSKTFTVTFWRNSYKDLSVGVAPYGSVFISQYDFASNASWAAKVGAAGAAFNTLECWLATNADGSTYFSAITPAGDLWSMGAIVVDLNQSNGDAALQNALRVRLFRDGVLATSCVYSDGTNPANAPSAVNNGTGTLKIGWLGSGYVPEINEALNRMGLWGRALSDAEILALYNAGHGKYCNDTSVAGTTQMSTAEKVGLAEFWNLTEAASGSRLGAVNGHTMAEVGATIPSVQKKTAVREKSPNGYTGYPLRLSVAPYDYTVPQPCGAPELVTDPLGRPSLKLLGNKILHFPGLQPFNFGSADIFEVLRYPAFMATEHFTFASFDESAAYNRMAVGETTKTSARRPYLRISNTGLTDLAVWPTDTAFVADTSYVSTWRLLGTGGAGSYVHRLNGVAGTMTRDIGGPDNLSFDDVLGRDNFAIGGAASINGVSCLGNEFHGEKLIYAPSLTLAQVQLVERYLALWAGIVIP